MLKLSAQSRWTEQVSGGISQHLLGCESEQTRHHHVAFPSQGRACPLLGLHCLCLQGKGATAQFCAFLCHRSAAGHCAQKNRAASVSSGCKSKWQCGNGGAHGQVPSRGTGGEAGGVISPLPHGEQPVLFLPGKS